MKTIKKELLAIELKKFIESVGVTILETNRIFQQGNQSEFERARSQAIILFGKDMIDNLKSFGIRTGVFGDAK